ncbi:hypothetical protein EV385_2346 [Krasilnikovia cinnamomea]|uniref:Uncharacterized protein n=1 Tax=Krasilnikovia cinnamomea TaxID=349313 RepID=A0A4Q7ZJA5_9ACTN|nr:PQQ-binding-like beta-propeller repeat protein [Krasilnikovia cinnamomea]RZU50571.1 hypothetical protein EV385_2346 [Krasilnikovia cinnamomea]
MASGGGWRGYAVCAVVVVIVLAATGVWNPFPKLWSWIDRDEPIAPGAAKWQARLGGTPRSVTIADDVVIVEYRTSIEAYGAGTGVRLWKSDADWSAVAGSGANAVVVTGRLITKGYQVLDPRTGAVRRTDSAATAVWTYTNAILDVHCGDGGCELTARDPRGGDPLWRVPSPSLGIVLDGDNPDLPGTRPLTGSQIDDQIAGPSLMPALLGLPEDRQVRIVDTAAGRLVQTVAQGTRQRVTVAGGRLLTVTGEARDGTCYYRVAATDPPATDPVWRRDLNLRTADDGAECRQDRDPVGGGDVVLGVDPVGRQVLIAAHDGRELWHGGEGERVLAVDDRYAVVREGDGRGARGRSLARGGGGWRRSIGAGTQAALTPYAAVLVEPKAGRVTAISPGSGAVLAEVKTTGKPYATGPGGLVLVSGRDLAYVPFAVDRAG